MALGFLDTRAFFSFLNRRLKRNRLNRGPPRPNESRGGERHHAGDDPDENVDREIDLLFRLAPRSAELGRPRAEHLAQEQKHRNGGRDQRDELEEHGGRRNIVGRAKRSVPAAARVASTSPSLFCPPYRARLMLASLQQ